MEQLTKVQTWHTQPTVLIPIYVHFTSVENLRLSKAKWLTQRRISGSSYLNCIFKGPIFKYSHILRYKGLGVQHMNLVRDTI